MSSRRPNHTSPSITTSALIVALLAACKPGGTDTPADTPPAGQLTYEQIDCDGWIGQAALIVGPDGTTVLWDVGNDGHADAVRDALRRNTGAESVDYTVITHFHGDHGGALDKLLEAGVDLGELIVRHAVALDASSGDVIDALEGRPAYPLCTEAACALPRRLDLGGGAVLDLVAANGQVLDVPFPSPLPDDDDGENARSVVGVLTWGDFAMVLPGDLTGGGKGTPDVESHVAAQLTTPASADVIVLGHHGIDSSTNATWIDRWLPDDGSPHHAIVGANASYLDAPADEVLDRLRGRVTDVWVTRAGSLAGADDLLHVASGPVVVHVTDTGAAYTLAP